MTCSVPNVTMLPVERVHSNFNLNILFYFQSDTVCGKCKAPIQGKVTILMKAYIEYGITMISIFISILHFPLRPIHRLTVKFPLHTKHSGVGRCHRVDVKDIKFFVLFSPITVTDEWKIQVYFFSNDAFSFFDINCFWKYFAIGMIQTF